MTQNLKLPTPTSQAQTTCLKDVPLVSKAKYIRIIMLMLWMLPMSVSAQFPLTWTGAVNSDWHNAGNWNPAFVPNAATPLVVIVNVSNDPVISSNANVGVVIVTAGSELTINAGVSLNISTAYSGSGVALLNNEGTVVNNGTINLTSNLSFMEVNAIKNSGSFTNESIYLNGSLSVAEINIKSSKGPGILSSGSFLNRGATINIGTVSTINGAGIRVDDGTFTNIGITIGQANPATINIDRTTDDGIEVSSNGSFSQANNTARIFLGLNHNISQFGIDNYGDFFLRGTVTIARSGWSGIRNRTGALLQNLSATLSIGTLAATGSHGIINDGLFNNNKTINIQRATLTGIVNNSIFNNNNNGNISLGSISFALGVGVSNTATFNNFSGGLLTIARSNDGIRNTITATFNNHNIIKIGTINPIGGRGIYNVGTFNNHLSIEVMGADTYGLENEISADFTNHSSGSLLIGTVQPTGLSSIWNGGTIHNHNIVEIGASLGAALTNDAAGQFNNNTNASLIIGAIGTIADDGIDNMGFFNTEGSIYVKSVNRDGIRNGGSGIFINQNGGDIDVGTSGGLIGRVGVYLLDGIFHNDNGNIQIENTNNHSIICQDGNFTNSSNGEIVIDNSQARGLTIFAAVDFVNSSTLTITNTADLALAFSSNGSGGTNLNNEFGLIKMDGEIGAFLQLKGTLAPGKSIGEIYCTGPTHMQNLDLHIEVNGPNPLLEHDQLNLDDVFLGGALDIDINYTPTSNDRIVFLTANTITGTFSNVNPALPANWSLDYSVLGEVAVTYSNPFPVEMLEFTAVKHDKDILLSWQTASETNNQGFEILHSTDANTWESIDFINGAGNTQHIQNYSFTHLNPASADNYYQLKQIDFDGGFSYSEVRFVHFEQALAEIDISLFPNPASEQVNITLPPSTTQGKLRISSLDGRELLQMTIPVEQGQIVVPTHSLPEGIFLISIQTGKIRKSMRLQILR